MLRQFPLPEPSFIAARALNQLLQQEAWARERLQKHPEQIVRLEVGPATLTLVIQEDGTTQAGQSSDTPDVTLTLPLDKLSELPARLPEQSPEDLTRLLHIQGDAGLAQTVGYLAQNLRWDVEHALAEKIGDIAALKVLGASRSLFSGLKTSGRNLAENAREYLVYEQPVLASTPTLETHAKQIQALQQRLDQAEQRLSHQLTLRNRHV